MGQRVRYPTTPQRRTAHLFSAHARTDPSSCVAFKCDETTDPPVHRWRLNARPGDRCFCGASTR